MTAPVSVESPVRRPVRHVEHCMGTVFTFDVRGDGVDRAALQRAVDWLHWVDATFSTYRKDSAISRLARGEHSVADCPREVGEVLELCRQADRASGGYFTATPGGALDPSGVVKGWAVERASELLRAAGSSSHAVGGGGDIQATGEAAPGQPWRIGIAHPLRPGNVAAVVTGRDLAVATSGTAERGSHVIDPLTGRTPTGLASVTVVGRRLSIVDGYATAALAMGTAGREWLQGLPGVRAFAVTSGGQTWQTGEFT